MLVETLLLLMSVVAMAMGLALLPAVWSLDRPDAARRYWAWGCFAIGWSWLMVGVKAAFPLDAAAMLADGFLVLGITLLAQAARWGGGEGKLLNPLWPIALLLAGHVGALFFFPLWTVRNLFVAIIVAWVAGRAGFSLLGEAAAPRRLLAIGFLMYGLLAIDAALYRYFSGHVPAADERAELIIRMSELAILVFLTTSYLVGRPSRAGEEPLSAEPATRDAVAGCFDRGTIERRLDYEFARSAAGGEPLTVLMIDLDHFKLINDTHGHPAGDAALRGVANVIGGQVRATDFVGRYGGDEFLILLPRTAAGEAQRVVERMRAGLAELAGEYEPPTISVGIAERQAGDQAETLILRADQALYVAKRQGRDRVVLAQDATAEKAAEN